MALISEKFHNDKLAKYKINIKTKYIVGNNILERNTDNSYNDDIENGIRCEKNYYINNKLVHTEKLFDSRIEYTFINSCQENNDYKCPNCGMMAKLKDFVNGCPYCGTHYNIDYQNKDLGSKYHYDRVLRNTTYRIVTAIIDLIISIILSFIFIKGTSRTFNNYDIYKVFIYGFILSLVLYYFFYVLDAYVILSPIKKYKDKQNQKQIDFWNRTNIDKKTFYNNLNYEVSKKYYQKDNTVDYDILDYLSFNDFSRNNKLHVQVKAYVRIIYYENNKLISKYIDDVFVLERHENETMQIFDGANIIKCHNCGSSIDVTSGRCEYCDSEIKYLQEWIMVD